MKKFTQALISSFTARVRSTTKTFYEVERIAQRDSAEFIYQNLGKSTLFKNKRAFHKFVIEQRRAKGLIMEFGVFKGASINFFSECLTGANDSRNIYGFDSFEGLSENWTGTQIQKSEFDLGGHLPMVNSNVKLTKGWVDETLPPFLEEQAQNGKPEVAFVHLDMDTYEPTRCVLELVRPYLCPGSIIVFDELLGYAGWRENEYKALIDTLGDDFQYEYIAFCEPVSAEKVSRFVRAALRITYRH